MKKQNYEWPLILQIFKEPVNLTFEIYSDVFFPAISGPESQMLENEIRSCSPIFCSNPLGLSFKGNLKYEVVTGLLCVFIPTYCLFVDHDEVDLKVML